MKRISNRLGFTKQSDPEKIEQDLMKELPKDHGYCIIFRSLRLEEVSVQQEILNAGNAS